MTEQERERITRAARLPASGVRPRDEQAAEQIAGVVAAALLTQERDDAAARGAAWGMGT